MSGTILLLLAAILFLVGLNLSAFFSGSETGFYRVSFLRLSIDAQAGDRVAARILWFAKNPSMFVATTLVGNNVANYLTTASIGFATGVLFTAGADWAEIAGTLLVSPVVFVFGELMPKSLYFRAPLKLLRRDSAKFKFFFWIFLPVSFPLVWVTRLMEKLRQSEARSFDSVLGRQRLVQLVSEGRQHGLLAPVQSQLVHGLLQTAAQQISDSVTPAHRVFGVDDKSSRRQILECARKFGVPQVCIKQAGTDDAWYGYIRVVDARTSRKPVQSLVQKMPRFDTATTKLEALLDLQRADASFGVVYHDQTLVGTISERGLVEQLFRSSTTDQSGTLSIRRGRT